MFKNCLLAGLLILSFYSGQLSKEPSLTLPAANKGGGLFVNMVTVLGFLRHCEKNNVSSFDVNFENNGHYYEEELGDNWVEYFFEPIHESSLLTNAASFIKLIKPTKTSQKSIAFFNYDGEHFLPIKKAANLIKKYVHVRPEIQEKIDPFKATHFENAFVIGIHYRGTDKYTEAPAVDYERVKLEVENALAEEENLPYKIFVATDSQGFYDYIEKAFPSQVVSIGAMKSTDGKPLHYDNENMPPLYHYHQGKEAVIDAYLLAETNLLIRSSSNLSLFSTYLKPELPVVELNQKYETVREIN